MPALLEDDGWTLEKCVELQARDPSVDMPAESARLGLEPGRRVVLFFVFGLGDGSVEGERLSVTITARDEHGGYQGRLDDDPMSSGALSAGDEITFHADHIVAHA